MRRFVHLVLALSIGACSSDPDDGGTPSAPPNAGVFENCVDFATRLCAGAQECCNSAYGSFSQSGCVDSFKREVCRPGASAVMAGKAHFDESAVEACLHAHADAHAVCVPTWEETLTLRKKLYSACRVIDGTSPPGAGCSIAATCQRPVGVGSVECLKNICTVIEVLPRGAACDFPSGSVSVCDDGLRCDAAGVGISGHCVEAPATGARCAPSSLESTECGLGSYCDREEAVCKVARNRGGSGCGQSTECVSFDCNRIESECAPAPAVLSRDTCLGPSQPL